MDKDKLGSKYEKSLYKDFLYGDELGKKLRERIKLDIFDYLDPVTKRVHEECLYTILYGEIGFTNSKLVEEYSLAYTALKSLMMNSPFFPFGYRAKEFARHKRIMEKRFEDVKNRLYLPPNFKSKKASGLKEIQEYLDKPFDERMKVDRPRVIGKTITINQVIFDDDKVNKSTIINELFLNRYDNVEHPYSYFIDPEKLKLENYEKWSLPRQLRKLFLKGITGLEMIEDYLKDFDVICYNIFELPVRTPVVEKFMNYLLAFHKKNPHIYIKDISGNGYTPYQDYSFYEELRKSKIDIGVF